MNRKSHLNRTWIALGFAAAIAGTLPGTAKAQDFGALIQQQMNQMNQMLNQGQAQVNQMVQQRMADPAVRQGYQQYLQQMQSQGRPPMDYATYTYYYIYTRGYSREGVAHMNRVESGNRAAEMEKVAGVRQAERNRGESMQAQRDSYFHNQQEAGRGLMGQSTYQGGGGFQRQLPHTWQPNTTHQYQGHVYHVDASGQYYVRGTDGWWYPINR